MQQHFALRARFVLPITSPPIEHGVVEVIDRHIVHVGKSTDCAVNDLGNVVLMPALINAHTHLEFSDLEEPLCPDADVFADWIQAVVAYRRQHTDEDRQAAIRKGWLESAENGVSLVGEIATTSWPAEVAPIDAVVFQELLGLHHDSIESQLQTAEAHLRQRRFGVGISPHATYSVRPDVLRHCVQLSRSHEVPLAMHIAETREELQLLRDHTGPIADSLRKVDFWVDGVIPPASRPLDYLRELTKAHRALIIHGNYLDEEEIEFLGNHRDTLSVVCCPRTHRFFEHEPYPLREMLKRGVRVAVGTDSRASNPDLSVFEELREVSRQFPDVDPAEILKMATINAAQVLGDDHARGSIQPNKRAQFCVVPVDSDDWTTILENRMSAYSLR